MVPWLFFRLRCTNVSPVEALFLDILFALGGRLSVALDIVELCFLGAVMRSDAATVGWEGRAVK